MGWPSGSHWTGSFSPFLEHFISAVGLSGGLTLGPCPATHTNGHAPWVLVLKFFGVTVLLRTTTIKYAERASTLVLRRPSRIQCHMKSCGDWRRQSGFTASAEARHVQWCDVQAFDDQPILPPRCNGKGRGVLRGVEQRSFALTVSPFGASPFATVNVLVSPGNECYTCVTCSTWSELGSTDTEQGTRVSRTVKRACGNRMTTVCNDATIRKSTLSQESPLIALVPQPCE